MNSRNLVRIVKDMIPRSARVWYRRRCIAQDSHQRRNRHSKVLKDEYFPFVFERMKEKCSQRLSESLEPHLRGFNPYPKNKDLIPVQWNDLPQELYGGMTYSMDSLIDLLSGAPVEIANIGIGGRKQAIFASGKTVWLNRGQSVAIENHGKTCSETVRRAMGGYSFTTEACGEVTMFTHVKRIAPAASEI